MDEDEDMVNGDATASTSKATKSKPKKAPVVDSDADDDDDESDDDAEVDEAFRNELLAALEANGIGEVFDAADKMQEGGEDAEEELLDDDQMMALDEKLADIFRLQGGAGKKGKQGEPFLPIFALPHRF